jgi:hypothetical protein
MKSVNIFWRSCETAEKKILKLLKMNLSAIDSLPQLEFGIFSELKNPGYFSLVRIENGTVCWPNEQDICPDTLFLDNRFFNRDDAILG